MAAWTAESGRFGGRPTTPKPTWKRTQKKKAERQLLRIGIVHSGRIIEERLIRPGRPVTVGEHARATVVVPRAELPERRFALFGVKGDGWELRFTPAMRGKLTVDGEVVSLSTLLQRDDAHRRRSAWSVPLDGRTRGKVHVGDYTFLFQLVPPPLRPARDPRRLRGLRGHRPDVLFLVTLIFSAVVHVAGLVWLDAHPPPRTVRLEELPPAVARLVWPGGPVAVPLPEEDATPDADDEATPLPADPPVDDPVSESEAAVEDSEPSEVAETAGQPRDRAALEEELRARGYEIFLIGSAHDGALGNPIEDLVGDLSGMSPDVGRALAQGNVRIARRRPEEVGLRTLAGDDELAVSDAGPSGAGGGRRGALVKERSGPAVAVRPVTIDAPPAVAASVSAVLKPYRGSIKACYERELKSLPDLAGKLTLSWVISEAGRVQELRTEVNTTGSPDLEACVRRVVGRITFSAGRGETFVDGYPLLFTSD